MQNVRPLPRNTLGATGIEVSALGLGCWGMSGAYGAADIGEAEATLRHAFDRGINFFDTADSYGDGENEQLVGRVLNDHRQQIVLATKVGFVKRIDSAGNKTTAVDGSPGHIRAACEASLARLRTDYLDLYYLHRVDPATPIEESVEAMAELVAAGKVRYLGLSEVSAATLRRAHAIHPITAVQSEYSLWTRNVEAEVLPACRELNVSLVAFSPLGRGFLTGHVRREEFDAGDFRNKNPRFSAENLQRNQALLETLRTLAERRALEPSQIALA